MARTGFSRVGHYRGARLYSGADPHHSGRGRPIRHAATDRSRQGGVLLSGRSRGPERNPSRPAPGGAGGDDGGDRGFGPAGAGKIDRKGDGQGKRGYVLV